MIDRFTGDKGKANLIEAILQQKVIANDHTVAENLAKFGELVEFKVDETIVEQDGDDDTVFFIINGKVNVFVNLQHVATREGGTVVGEMVVVDPTARRSATLKAGTVVTALKVSAENFKKAGETSVSFWRNLAVLAGDRLRERSKFHQPANKTPIMFMGSSVEGLKVAQEIEAGMKHASVIVRSWTTNGVFGPSRLPIDDLIKQVNIADFAVFVFGPDDKISSRHDDYMVPRDNVVFEMGLFIGKLGAERVFMVIDADVDLKIPTDLTGVNPITYKCKPGCDIADVIGTVCTDLRKVISAKGVVTHRMKG